MTNLTYQKFCFHGLTYFILLFLFTSCKKLVDIPSPEGQISTAEVFSNDQSAISAITGLYNRMITTNLLLANGGVTIFTALSSDELYTTGASNTLDVFSKNQLLSNNSNVQGSLWVPAYKAIYHANSILEAIKKSTTLTDSIRRQLTGEALLIRAFHYFYLANLFGDVPLVTSTDYQANSIMPRTSVSTIYDQIINDLIQAESLMSQDYPTPGRARANSMAANCLLSRVYLFRKNWVQAEMIANRVISSGLYALVPDLNKVFLNTSTETVWQLANDINNTAEGITLIPASPTIRPNYAITANLLNAFDSGDQRKIKWLKSNTISGQPYYYPNKYKSRINTPITEYYIVFRLAEQFLIRAEARAQQDRLPEAISDINIIRNRAGLPNSNALQKDSVLSEIDRERRLELFTEWGFRWLDLKRSGMADTILGPLKAPNWEPTDVLYPIPLVQIQTNPFLVQNPGY